MNGPLNDWLNALFRWIHVIAGVLWIGHLYFFNFVNAQVAKTYDADSKRKVVPELMPRALYFFRWGAAWTWITGIVLWGLVYAMGGALLDPEATMSPGVASVIVVAVLVVGFLIYDLLWKSALKNNQMAGMIVSLVLVAGIAWGMNCYFTGRAVMIQVGALFGTIMAANVWMRIWPSQRKIIAAIKGGQAPDAAVVALAGMRSKHNTFMSVPVLFLMVSNHSPMVYAQNAWAWTMAFVLAGFGIAWWLYKKSGEAAPTKF